MYLSEVILGLEEIHKLSIVHRDVKPDNMMIDSQGHIKIIDFGFSKILEVKNQLRTYTNCGTSAYTAPEVLQGYGHSFEADIWSFGIMLIELLTGSLPFDRVEDPFERDQMIIQGDVKMHNLDH